MSEAGRGKTDPIRGRDEVNIHSRWILERGRRGKWRVRDEGEVSKT